MNGDHDVRLNRRRRRRDSVCTRRLDGCRTAAIASTFALFVSAVSAFQASVVPRFGSTLSTCLEQSFARDKPGQSRAATQLMSTVAVDTDTLLLERMGKQVGELNEIYFGLPETMNLDEKRSQTVRFRGISQTPHPKKKKKTIVTSNGLNSSASKKTKISRSSTMPGFSTESDRQRAHKAGLRLIEERTGKRFEETTEAKRRRRKESGEAMYKSCASVPDSMVMFAEEIHQEDMISRAEEIELGEKTQEAIRLQSLYDNLEVQLGREPTDEEWCAAAGRINMEAIGQVIEEGLEAKNKLVTSNLRMVQSVVNTYIRNGLSAQYNAADMMQEGIVALIRAAEKFEPDRGWKFSTYAMYWVRASVKRNQIFQSRIINVPSRVHENHKRLLRVQKELTAVLGRAPTKKELGDAVGMSELQVTRCFTAMKQKCFSLDEGIKNTRKPMSGDTERDSLIEIVESRTEDGEYIKQNRIFLREDLIETLSRHLKPHEVELLLLRYGLHENSTTSGRQVPIIELSEMVGWKPDKVRRTINRSLKQLKSVGVDEWLSFEREFQ